MDVYSCAVHCKDDFEMLKRFHQALIAKGVRDNKDWNSRNYPGCKYTSVFYCLCINEDMYFINHDSSAPICYSLTEDSFNNLVELISNWWHKTYGNKQQDDPIPVTTITVKHNPPYTASADGYEVMGKSLEDAVRNLLYEIEQSKTRNT